MSIKKKLSFAILACWLIISSILITFIINIVYFNDIGVDAALVMDYANHIAEDGKPIVTLWNDLFGKTGYNFTYFPLFPVVVAGIIKLIGYKYVALKIASLFFYLANITILYFICCRFLPFWLSFIIVLLYSIDPLIISDTMSGLYGSFFGFIFLISFILYKKGRVENKVSLKLIGGILAGLSGIVHLLGIIWMIIIFPIIKILDFIFKSDKKIKSDIEFILPFLFIIGFFSIWIFWDTERWNIFNMQVLSNITNKQILTIHQSPFKAILNPVADFYLAIFRSYSILPLIIISTLFYMIFKLRENYFEFPFLFMPLVSFIFLVRTESYIVMIAPVIYTILADMCSKDNNCKKLELYGNKLITAGLISILLFYFSFDIFRLLHKPSLVFDKVYYTNILETNTEDNSNIVTDPVLILSATGGRKIYSISILIYYWFRTHYIYEDLVKRLSPDYIILTERMKRWGEMKDKFNQRDKFKKLLQEDFILNDVIKNGRYGDIWIYKAKIE